MALIDANDATFLNVGNTPAGGLLRQAAEAARQRRNSDDKYFRELLCYFELRVGSDTYIYPLVLPPQSMKMGEPFSVNKSYGDGGGLFVEEKGILYRDFSIAGTTGWKPRKLKASPGRTNAIPSPVRKSFSRRTTNKSSPIEALSGQRHFQFLNDTVFRTYADLKQDPNTSPTTSMFFHNIKDDERWRVIPVSFDMNQDSSRPLEYFFDIRMWAVEPSSESDAKFIEDRPLMALLSDPLAMIRSGVVGIRAGLKDLSAVEGALRTTSASFTDLLTNAVGIADDAQALVDGAVELIETPFSLVLQTIQSGEQALADADAIVDDVKRLPANLINTLRKIQDALHVVASYPSKYRSDVRSAVANFQKLRSLAASRKASTLSAASAQAAPRNVQSFSMMGTQSYPGDQSRAAGDLGLGAATPNYVSAFEHILEQGETLLSLAAKFLGDGRNWRYIAIFNDLRAPFISLDGMPGTLTVGDRILIPSTSRPPTVQDSPATLGVRPDEAPDVHALGRDYLMSPVSRDTYDLEIDLEGGSVDFRKVQGIPNLAQAVRSLLITEQGTDLLYVNLGTSRVVALGLGAADLETVRIRLSGSVEADPRIASVRDISFVQDNADSLVADLIAEVRGFTRPERLTISANT